MNASAPSLTWASFLMAASVFQRLLVLRGPLVEFHVVAGSSLDPGRPFLAGHGAVRHIHCGGDLLVILALHHQAQHFFLSLGEFHDCGLSYKKNIGKKFLVIFVRFILWETFQVAFWRAEVECSMAVTEVAFHDDAASHFHLFRYLDEQAFRFNLRKGDDQDRFLIGMKGILGKLLRYKELIGAGNETPNGLPA